MIKLRQAAWYYVVAILSILVLARCGKIATVLPNPNALNGGEGENRIDPPLNDPDPQNDAAQNDAANDEGAGEEDAGAPPASEFEISMKYRITGDSEFKTISAASGTTDIVSGDQVELIWTVTGLDEASYGGRCDIANYVPNALTLNTFTSAALAEPAEFRLHCTRTVNGVVQERNKSLKVTISGVSIAPLMLKPPATSVAFSASQVRSLSLFNPGQGHFTYIRSGGITTTRDPNDPLARAVTGMSFPSNAFANCASGLEANETCSISLKFLSPPNMSSVPLRIQGFAHVLYSGGPDGEQGILSIPISGYVAPTLILSSTSPPMKSYSGGSATPAPKPGPIVVPYAPASAD